MDSKSLLLAIGHSWSSAATNSPTRSGAGSRHSPAASGRSQASTSAQNSTSPGKPASTAAWR